MVHLLGVKSGSDKTSKAKVAVLLSWMLASVVVWLCDGVLPDADWAEQPLYSNYKTYEYTTVTQ